ncbi:MAG: dTDP-4-dehydrorhamnose reductase [Actinomycetota bacterium]|nr:dTDP-4-dehydrorhamnose reductase [Actinomycetota bacterium]
MSLALLVTGAGGQLSDDLLDAVRGARDVFARGLTIKDLDITDAFAVQDMVVGWERIVRSDNPDHRLVVVNCAAYTAVDAAETDEETAYAVNAAGPALLATACAKVGAGLIHVSTDYVFPGDAKQPYDVDDPTGPQGAYGRTKLAGELAVREILPDDSWVVRTAWLYGAHGNNIIKTMTRLERERETVAFVADQTGSPTWSHDLAGGLLALAGSDAPAGNYHATNRGETTWYGLARAVFEEVGADPDRVQPIRTEDYPLPAPRPAYSVLSPRAWDAAGLPPFRGWREALAEAFATSGDAFRP